MHVLHLLVLFLCLIFMNVFKDLGENKSGGTYQEKEMNYLTDCINLRLKVGP